MDAGGELEDPLVDAVDSATILVSTSIEKVVVREHWRRIAGLDAVIRRKPSKGDGGKRATGRRQVVRGLDRTEATIATTWRSGSGGRETSRTVLRVKGWNSGSDFGAGVTGSLWIAVEAGGEGEWKGGAGAEYELWITPEKSKGPGWIEEPTSQRCSGHGSGASLHFEGALACVFAGPVTTLVS